MTRDLLDVILFPRIIGRRVAASTLIIAHDIEPMSYLRHSSTEDLLGERLADNVCLNRAICAMFGVV